MVVLGDGFLSEERRKDINFPYLNFAERGQNMTPEWMESWIEEKSGNGADTQGFLMNGRQEVMRKSILCGARGV